MNYLSCIALIGIAAGFLAVCVSCAPYWIEHWRSKCSECSGAGYIGPLCADPWAYDDCPKCNGSGRASVTESGDL